MHACVRTCACACVRACVRACARAPPVVYVRLVLQMIEDQAKLQVKLLPSDVHAAYACGCTWQTVDDTKDITVDATQAAPHGGISEGRMRWKAEA